MKNLSLILLILVLLFNKREAPVGGTNGGWKTYETKYYTIKYPPDWKIDSSETWGNNLALIPPKAAGDMFGAGVQVRVSDNSRGTEYYDSSGVEVVKQIKPQENEYSLDTIVRFIESMDRDTMKLPSDTIIHHIEESVRKRVNGIEYHSLTATHQNKHSKWKTKLYLFENKNMGYDVGFMASQARYEELISSADKILDSFHLK